jgi:hypothetical protein
MRLAQAANEATEVTFAAFSFDCHALQSPESRQSLLLATISSDDVVRVHDFVSGRLLAEWACRAERVTFCPARVTRRDDDDDDAAEADQLVSDADLIAIGDRRDPTLRRFCLRTQQELWSVEADAAIDLVVMSSCTPSPRQVDGDDVAIGRHRRTHAESQTLVLVLACVCPDAGPVNRRRRHAAAMPAVQRRPAGIWMWDADTGDFLKVAFEKHLFALYVMPVAPVTLAQLLNGNGTASTRPDAEAQPVRLMAVATASTAATYVWDVWADESVARVTRQRGESDVCVACSADGRWLAAGGTMDCVVLYRLSVVAGTATSPHARGGQRLCVKYERTLTAHARVVLCLCFSRNGEILLCGGAGSY